MILRSSNRSFYLSVMTGSTTKPQPNSDDYTVFLLRIWSATEQGWNGSIENMQTGETQRFILPEHLLSHLYRQFSAESHPTGTT